MAAVANAVKSAGGLLERLFSHKQKEVESKERGYAELVRDVVDGLEITEFDAIQVLETANKTTEEFAADVAEMKRRDALRLVARELDELKDDHRDALDNVAALEEERVRFITAMNDRQQAAATTADATLRKVVAAERARNELQRLAFEESDELKEFSQKIADVQKRIMQCEMGLGSNGRGSHPDNLAEKASLLDLSISAEREKLREAKRYGGERQSITARIASLQQDRDNLANIQQKNAPDIAIFTRLETLEKERAALIAQKGELEANLLANALGDFELPDDE